MLEDILSSLGLGAEESRIYLTLLKTGPSPAGTLAKQTGMKRPSVYGFLKRLIAAGAVNQTLKDGTKIFVAATPQAITGLFRDKIEALETQRRQLETIIPDLEKNMGGGFMAPRFEFFEGREGIQNVLKDMLLYSGVETRSYWPMQAMIDILGADFFRYHNRVRILNKIAVKAIWPQHQVIKIKDHPYLGAGKDYLREIRIAPPEIKFSMGYWIYKNKVAFLSSLRESYGFIIESDELAEMLTSQHEIMWQASERLHINEEDTTSFLRELKSGRL